MVDPNPIALAVSPHGVPYDENRTAFAADPFAALLDLGARRDPGGLPASTAFARRFARAFVTELSRLPDLEAQRENASVPPNAAVLDEFERDVPPMTGAEYVTREVLETWWRELEAAFRREIRAHAGTVEQWLAAKSPAWSMVGRVCFQLAENKKDPKRPFAFLATYTSGTEKGRVQYQPLSRALKAYAGEKDTLLHLLEPVQRAANQSPFVRALVDSGRVYSGLAWTADEAHQFLVHVPVFESAGLTVRVPDWWKVKRPRRPEVRVTIGEPQGGGLGADALLGFDVALTLDGEVLTPGEWKELLSSAGSLALVRGKWVEIDKDKLAQVLDHWKTAEVAARNRGLSFAEAMRLLAGMPLAGDEAAEVAEDAVDWSNVVAGPWLAKALEGLRHPDGLPEVDVGGELHAELRPYQKIGVRWLYLLDRLGLGACLADDMGLGKTIQVLALLLATRRKDANPGPSLLVVPASLIGNWKAEIDRFAPSLRTFVAHPSAAPSAQLASFDVARLAELDLVITSYAFLSRLEWLRDAEWRTVILDEAQAIKNAETKQARAAKALKSRTRLALTGTPVENRLSDLWSLFDFICPGLLGNATVFAAFVKRLSEKQAYAPLRELVRPYILRRQKSDKKIIADLPDKTEMLAYCSLTKSQAAHYQKAVEALADTLKNVDGIQRRGAILSFLLRFKQICNHPSQWLGDGVYAPGESGKLARLKEIAEAIAARQEKVLVFTQFKEMTAPLASFLEGVFGKPGLVLHGETPVGKRKGLVDAFQAELGPPFFVLSIKAGGTGLNLTAASHVVHFDRWWNPAVENQATDRAYRIGQKKNVLVHKFVCRGTIEERIDQMIESKKTLSSEVLDGDGGVTLTELSDAALLELVRLDVHTAMAE